MHLIIDGYSSNQKILRDEDLLRKWLEDYPARIGMTRISPPYVIKYAGPVLEDWGISGFVFIAESHIGIHTFVEQLRAAYAFRQAMSQSAAGLACSNSCVDRCDP